jgi:hypothetical protein
MKLLDDLSLAGWMDYPLPTTFASLCADLGVKLVLHSAHRMMDPGSDVVDDGLISTPPAHTDCCIIIYNHTSAAPGE